MRTYSAEEFKKIYGNEALEKFQPTQETERGPSYGERVMGTAKTSLEERSKRINAITARPDTNIGVQAVQAAGQGAGFAADVIETAVTEAPGVKQALKPVGKAIEWAMEPGASFFKKLQGTYGQLNPNTKDIVDATANFVRLGTDVAAAGQGVKAISKAPQAIKQGVGAVKGGVEKGVESMVGGLEGAKVSSQGVSQNIMNRVARLNPTDEVKFKKVSGKTPGEYLTETGNFGDPQSIIAKEAEKFAASKGMVDDTFSKLPGEYKVDAIDDALNMLSKKGAQVSSPGVKAPFMAKVEKLIAKSKIQGLNMGEINEVKRLLEREVKLGYNKLTAPNTVAKATNIDSAIRKWQFSKARYLGFKNIDVLNKQTQISKFLVDKLGDKIVGQSALNNISLTDWVVLSGGDPTAIAGFLTKKFFSSKSVQGKIAKMLGGKEGQSLITPEVSLQPEYLQQKALPAGQPIKGRYPSEGISIPAAPTTFEAQAPGISPKKFLDVKVLQNIENLTPDEMSIPIRSVNLTPKNLLRLGVRYLKEKKLIPKTEGYTKKSKTLPIKKY